MQFPVAAAEIIPQQPPMCVIDTLDSIVEQCGVASVTVRPDCPFVLENGTLDEIVYIEMLAQTAAAHQAYVTGKTGDEKIKGYFLGAKHFEIHDSAHIGDRLTLRIVKNAEYVGFAIVQGRVLRGNELVAGGELKFWHD